MGATGWSMTAVVVNPRAGGGRAGTRFACLLRQRPLVPAEAVFLPESLPQLHTLARRLVEQGCQRLVVVGGDGTLHRVVNALYQAGALGSVTLGLVPAGTGSDLARALGLPRSLDACWQLALTTPPRPLDAGLLAVGAEEVLFANVASAGLSGLVDELVNANPGRGAWLSSAPPSRHSKRFGPNLAGCGWTAPSFSRETRCW